MRQKRSHVVIFCAYLGMVAYGNISMLALGWTLWALFVAVFAGAGLVMAWAMFREPKFTPRSTTTATQERPGPGKGNEAPSAAGSESSGVRGQTRQMVPREASTTMDSVEITERLMRNAEETANRMMNDSIEATRKLQENSMEIAERAAKADVSKWDGGEMSSALPGVEFRFSKGKPVEPSETKAEAEKETEPETAFDASGAEDVNP